MIECCLKMHEMCYFIHLLYNILKSFDKVGWAAVKVKLLSAKVK